MFQTFKLSFDVYILTLFGLATVLATLSKIWVTFAQSSGHLDYFPAEEELSWTFSTKSNI
jgi:hypothetical protein